MIAKKQGRCNNTLNMVMVEVTILVDGEMLAVTIDLAVAVAVATVALRRTCAALLPTRTPDPSCLSVR